MNNDTIKNMTRSGSYDVFPQQATNENPTGRPYHVNRSGQSSWQITQARTSQPMMSGNSASSSRQRPQDQRMSISSLLNPSDSNLDRRRVEHRASSVQRTPSASATQKNPATRMTQVAQQLETDLRCLYHQIDSSDRKHRNYESLNSETPAGSFFNHLYNAEKRHFVVKNIDKAPGDKVYSSDVALIQMAMFENKSNALIPSRLPKMISHDNVVNESSLITINRLTAHQSNSTFNYGSSQLQELLSTPNGKATNNLVSSLIK